ncbi:MAG: hypothetical protein GF341_04105 [candidate division Zixibacteria bacterium]|nr:hypothetical protein [candidate division Zixibacteria bacterium]
MNRNLWDNLFLSTLSAKPTTVLQLTLTPGTPFRRACGAVERKTAVI